MDRRGFEGVADLVRRARSYRRFDEAAGVPRELMVGLVAIAPRPVRGGA